MERAFVTYGIVLVIVRVVWYDGVWHDVLMLSFSWCSCCPLYFGPDNDTCLNIRVKLKYVRER